MYISPECIGITYKCLSCMGEAALLLVMTSNKMLTHLLTINAKNQQKSSWIYN